MPEYVFSARIEDGRLKVGLRTLQIMREALAGWRRCDVTVTIEKKHAIRSVQANAYYWGVVIALIAEHTGYTPEETHDALKTLFLPKRLAMLGRNGELHQELVIGGSTTKLNTIEFSEYVSRIREWAGDTIGVVIPAPDPEWREHVA